MKQAAWERASKRRNREGRMLPVHSFPAPRTNVLLSRDFSRLHKWKPYAQARERANSMKKRVKKEKKKEGKEGKERKEERRREKLH